MKLAQGYEEEFGTFVGGKWSGVWRLSGETEYRFPDGTAKMFTEGGEYDSSGTEVKGKAKK